MRSREITLTLTAAVGNAVCASQNPAAGGEQALAINGANASAGVATFATACHVSVTSSGNDSARTFTITGTDRYGNIISETIAGANPTGSGAKNFKTVTGVTVDDDTAGNITVGRLAVAETAWIPTNQREPYETIGVVLSSGANLTYTVQHTLSNVDSGGVLESDALPINDATLANKTATQMVGISQYVAATRLAITAWSTGSATLQVMQRQTQAAANF
jgi:hypothetical protein